MSRFRRRIIALVIAILVIAAAILLRPRAATAPAAAASPVAVLTVEAVQPQRLDWPLATGASGGIYAWQTASISSESAGLRIEQLLVDVGSVVRKGQLLARLASDSVAADLRSQEANVAQARGKLAQAEAEAERAHRLKDNGTLSEQKVLDYQVSAQTARATLDAALAALDAQRIALARTRIVAIDDGIVTARSASLGQVVTIGTELFQLMRQQRLEWRAEVTASQMTQLQAGQKARLTLSDGKSVDARLRLVAPTLNANTRTGIAYFDLPASALTMGAHPGIYVHGEIRTGAGIAIVLPSTAVTLRDGNSYVFEISADAHVLQRQVRTGRRIGEQVEVLGDLAANSRFVNGGGSFLKDGDAVQVRSDAPRNTAPSKRSAS
ncbi:MAG: efflux RND transporter periplasmic adaptor subunit [Sphingomonadaceae bacterium]